MRKILFLLAMIFLGVDIQAQTVGSNAKVWWEQAWYDKTKEKDNVFSSIDSSAIKFWKDGNNWRISIYDSLGNKKFEYKILGNYTYLNLSGTGSDGYGFRNNSGTLEYKNSGGSWTSVGSQWVTSGSDIYYTTGNVVIGGTTATEDFEVMGDVATTGVFGRNSYSNIRVRNTKYIESTTGSAYFGHDEYGDVNIGASRPHINLGHIRFFTNNNEGSAMKLKLTLRSSGNLLHKAGSYYNFGTTEGTDGYGFHDNSGTMQYKNSGESWVDIGSSINSVEMSAAAWLGTITNGATDDIYQYIPIKDFDNAVAETLTIDFKLNDAFVKIDSLILEVGCEAPIGDSVKYSFAWIGIAYNESLPVNTTAFSSALSGIIDLGSTGNQRKKVTISGTFSGLSADDRFIGKLWRDVSIVNNVADNVYLISSTFYGKNLR